jgi:hypothetical protein
MTIHAALNDLTNAVRADRVMASGRNELTPDDRLFLAQLRARILLSMGEAVTRLVDIMDELQGDPDLENVGGSEEEQFEDWTRASDYGPGDPIADGGDIAWVEWDKMRGSQKRGPCLTGSPLRFNEDDEDDDPAEDSDGDEENGDTELNGDEGDHSEGE